MRAQVAKGLSLRRDWLPRDIICWCGRIAASSTRGESESRHCQVQYSECRTICLGDTNLWQRFSTFYGLLNCSYTYRSLWNSSSIISKIVSQSRVCQRICNVSFKLLFIDVWCSWIFDAINRLIPQPDGPWIFIAQLETCCLLLCAFLLYQKWIVVVYYVFICANPQEGLH